LDLRHELDVSFQCVACQILHLSFRKSSWGADHRMSGKLVLVFDLETDGIHFEERSPIYEPSQGLRTVLMMFGVPVKEAKRQSGPILNHGFRQVPTAAASEAEKLKQALHAMKQAWLAVPRNLNSLWRNL